MSYLQLLRLVSPEAIVVLTALGILAIGLMQSRRTVVTPVSAAEPRASAGGTSAATPACAMVAGLGLVLAIAVIFILPRNATVFAGMLVISPLNALFKIICLVLALVTVALTEGEKALRNRGEYLAIVLLATVGLMLLVGSEELLMIFIGLELLGLSLYVLTGFDKIDIFSAEAGLKYFLFGSTASAFTLFGISLVYGMSGSTSLALIAQKLAIEPMQPLLAGGIVMTLIGFAFKIAAAPFHLWAPDAYQGAPVTSAAFIASGSKVASFVVLGKIVLIGFAPLRGSADWHALVAGWSPVLAVLAAVSILLGNFVALAQTNVRRLLAYSAVAHGGYTLLGIIAGSREGFAATLFYTTIYAVTLVGAFAVVGIVRRETGGDNLANFVGLRARSPLAAACMSIFMLSLAGIPPLAGFFGKFYLFSVALRAGENHGLLWLVAVALFGSFVSLYYYLMVIKAMFVEEPATRHEVLVTRLPRRSAAEAGHSSLVTAVVAALAAIVLLFGIDPSGLITHILNSLE
ncbi:MAG TPA: NADH-quinone oxidoreductase subunit N [Chthoniobacterales bacterium]